LGGGGCPGREEERLEQEGRRQQAGEIAEIEEINARREKPQEDGETIDAAREERQKDIKAIAPELARPRFADAA
jgi:hypothetical protein